MGFFDKIKQGFKKTSDAVSHSLDSVFAAFVKIDEDLLEELEEALILSDVGASTSAKIVAEVEKRAKLRKTTTASELRDLLREVLTDNMLDNQPLDVSGKPAVILVIGVNGVGKTTSIGKLAARYVSEGKKVMLSAADTFRAAAADQLEIWAKRAGADIVRHGEGADPAAVVFDSISAAKARGSDIIIVDTAGRLHNKANLMNELAKIDRVISRELPDASRETLLVLDATTGQNAVHQAEEFNKAAELTGIILTKLDGTAKGGIVIAISAGLGVPVKLVGVGEGIDDLIDFDRVDMTNLNRQQYFLKDLGQYKTEALRSNLRQINPFTDITIDTVKVTDENVPTLFENEDIICEAFDVPENKTMLVNAVLENLPGKKLVSASGMAGFRSSNLVSTRRVSKNFYFCGDGETAPVPGAGLMAPRVGVVACHEANMITRLILGEEDA